MRKRHKPSPWLGPGRRAAVPAALLAALLTTAVTGPARATPDVQAGPVSCQPHIAQAERYYHLPQGLLLAVALTESGHAGTPSPWALNIGGTPYFPTSYREAARLVRTQAGQPRRDAAIGCMQIHMTYHLEAFGAPEWALHPLYNVWYGAQFLRDLAVRHGSWLAAIGSYHGGDAQTRHAYLCRVARYLRKTGPATWAALGLQHCASTPPPPLLDGVKQRRAAIQAARRIGRIIVLGRDRLGG